MTDVQMWALIVGFLSPAAIALVNRPTWSSFARTSVMVATSTAVGLGTSYFAGDFAGHNIVTNALIAATGAIASYKGIFQPTGIAAAIERLTSPQGARKLHPAGR